MTRKPGFDLATELAKPSFTPGARDAPALVELVVASEDDARAAAALAKLGEVARRAIAARIAHHDERMRDALGARGDESPALGTAGDGDGDVVALEGSPVGEAARARLLGVVGLLARAGDAEARAMLIAALRDSAPRVRRSAASALGKLGEDNGGDEARVALLARWEAGDVTPDERRVLVEALGKLGGDEVLARVRALDVGGDTELARRRDRALLMADRSAKREEESQILVDVPPPMPLIVRLGCKAGLASLLVDELASLGMPAIAKVDREAEIELGGPLSTLFASHLWASVTIRVPFRPGPDLAASLVPAICELRPLLRAWTRGPIRWRLGFASGHKRAVVWRVARDVTAAAPELVNDPSATTWDIFVDESVQQSEQAALSIVPRKLDDPRFAWRVAEVPAASQPSVAAALVWVAGMRDDDRVWDPFCGSAVELVERARRGPFKKIIGSDIDERALEAARKNAAGMAIEFAHADARSFDPGEVDLVITNPPLGSRVHVDAATLLVESVPGFARRLARGGRLVWITPAFRRTTPACERAGLRRVRSMPVDLGGVRGHLERWDK